MSQPVCQCGPSGQVDGSWCRYDDLSDSGVSVGVPQRNKLQGLAGGRASMERPTSLRGALLSTYPCRPCRCSCRASARRS